MSPLPSDEPETRDAWWLEVRNEVRSHMRAMGCNAVIGYSESTSIWWAQSLVAPSYTVYPVSHPWSYSESDTQGLICRVILRVWYPGSDIQGHTQSLTPTESDVQGHTRGLIPRVWCGSYSESDTQGLICRVILRVWYPGSDIQGHIQRKGVWGGGDQPHFEWSLWPRTKHNLGLARGREAIVTSFDCENLIILLWVSFEYIEFKHNAHIVHYGTFALWYVIHVQQHSMPFSFKPGTQCVTPTVWDW